MTERANQDRVLVIGGWGRCGSTLLDMLLGQVPGVVSGGEIREIWLRGCVEDRPCGCGKSFHTCPFWTAVGDYAYGGWGRLDIERVLHVRYTVDRAWGAPQLLVGNAHPRSRSEDRTVYLTALSRLFSAILAVSGAAVVVDSSKLPTHTMLLRSVPGLDVRLVHLVRDSRGVAYSNRKLVIKDTTTGAPTALPQNGPVKASARYMLYNGLTSMLSRTGTPYRLLRYEDLIAEPERRLREVLAHAGVSADVDLPFLSDGAATMAPNHLVDGNPVRFAQGSVQLRVDDEWRRLLPRRERRLVTALTSPLLAGYGYPLR